MQIIDARCERSRRSLSLSSHNNAVRSRRRSASRLSVAAILCLAWACGGQSPTDEVEGTVAGTISGVVFKGLLAEGQVTVRSNGDGNWSETIASGTTDAAGAFDIDVGLGRGDLLIEVTGGRYIEEATGNSVGLGTRTMKAWAPSFGVGESRGDVQVNPVTTLIVAYTKWLLESGEHENFTSAKREATTLLEGHFGGVDWRSRLPENPTTRTNLPFTNEAVMGVLIAGLSWQTREMAESADTTSRAVNSAALLDLLVEDIREDGKFNGLGRNGRALSLHDQFLDGQTLRQSFALSTLRFLQSTRNVSGINRDDVYTILEAIATNNSKLFDSDPSPWSLEPPTITIENPAPGSAARGVIDIVARAADPNQVTDLGFSEPDALRPTDPVGRYQAEATISASLDTSLFPDGPLGISLFAENDRGLRAEKTFEIIVANETPIVHIESPSHGEEIDGIQIIRAHAEPNPVTGASITSLFVTQPEELVDTSGIANRFEAMWDTTTELDGEYTIEIRAEDEYGAQGYSQVTVELTNRDPVTIFGRALVAGRPIDDGVVTALALDEPCESSYTGFVHLGSTRTNTTGHFEVTLSDRNYEGPLSVRIGSGGTWTSPISESTFTLDGPRHLSTYLPEPRYLQSSGEQHQPLIVGAWSTIADRLARYYVFASPENFGPHFAWQRAEEMISGHFRRSAFPNLHTTTTHDLTSVERSLQEAFLSLGDIGLIWMLRNRQDASALDIIDALARDIATGVFDGDDGNMTIVPVGGISMDVDTTRLALALAIHDFAASDHNASGMDQEALLTIIGGTGLSFLDNLSADEREIYGGAEGQYFDRAGPSIHWIEPAAPDTVFGEETVIVEATATDTTGVASFEIVAPLIDDQPPFDEASEPDRVRARINNTVLPNSEDHEIRVTLLATDQLGNESLAHRFFTREPPSAHIDEILQCAGEHCMAPNDVARGVLEIEASWSGGFATAELGLVSPDPTSEAVTTSLEDEHYFIEIDTSADIEDGPLSIEFCHATIEGRQDCDSRTLLIDNSSPEVSFAALTTDSVPRFGCTDPFDACSTAPVNVSYMVSDATSGVSEIRLIAESAGELVEYSAESLPFGACVSEVCEGSLEVELPAGAFGVRLEAIDHADNADMTEDVAIVVDTSPPSLQDFSGTFDDEDGLDFLREGSSFVYQPRENHVPFQVADAIGGGAQWKKMEHRLSANTVSEAEAENVPVIEIAAWDPAEPGTSADELVVEYLYSWAQAGDDLVDSSEGWRPLIPLLPSGSGDGDGSVATHALPLSLEWLGEELAEYQTHQVRVRAVDQAGNRTELSYGFSLQLFPAPVAIEVDEDYSQSGDPESLYAYGFEHDNLSELFNERDFEDDRVRIARLVVHQPHEGLDVLVKTDVLDELRIDRSRAQTVVDGRLYRHYCAWQDCEFTWNGFTCFGCRELVEPDSSILYPPCFDEWGAPERESTYLVFTDDGHQCFDENAFPMMGEDQSFFEQIHSDADVVFFDEDGQSLPTVQPSVVSMPTGTYTGYIRVPLPEDFMSSVYEHSEGTVHGEVIESRRVFDHDMATDYVEREEDGGCVFDYNCIPHATRHQEVVLYESDLVFRGEREVNGEAVVGMSLETGSANPLISVWRDPSTNGSDSAHDSQELYPVHHVTSEDNPL